MIPLYDNDILVSSVFLVNCLCVVLFDKVIVFSRYEEGRNETFIGMRNWGNVFDVDIRGVYCLGKI